MHFQIAYEATLKYGVYQQTEQKSKKKEQRMQKQNHRGNMTWFNPPFSRNFTINLAERIFNLLDLQFPKSNKIRKIFNRNTSLSSIKSTRYLTETLSK